MAYLNRDGVKIYYETTGSGPAVLLSHGYSSTGEAWQGQVAAFSPRHRVITWDMRGHGRSDSPDDPDAYSEAHTVEDMAAILAACGAEQAVIGGLSLGGYMSLAFHYRYPEKTRALMLIDTGPGYKKDSGRDAWNATAQAQAGRFESEGLAALGGSDEVRLANHRSAAGLAHAARGMLAQRDARIINSLPEIAVPTLVLVGEDDTPFRAATDYMAGKIPGATKVVLAGAGHASNIQQPEAFNRALSDFLDGI